MKFDPNEIIGLVATIIVFASYSFSDVKKLRILNIVGSVLFVVYGFILPAYSTALLNIACIVMNSYKIYKLKKN